MKCNYNTCKKKSLPYNLGLCKYCNNNFCNFHQNIDIHLCKNLNLYIESKKKRLEMSILNNKIISNHNMTPL